MAKSITIRTGEQQRPLMLRVWQMVTEMIKGGPVVVTLTRESKTREMEKKYHCMINDISKQVTFFGTKTYAPEIWKALLVDKFEQEKLGMGEPLTHPGQLITSMDGRRTITVRPSTTQFRKHEAAEFIEFLYAQGCEMKVNWSEPALAIYAENREAQQSKEAA